MDKPSTPCLEYRGPRHKFGYGHRWFRRADGTRYKTTVHRWVWEQVHGPLPTDVHVLHRCDNPPCFRYDHLFAGSAADNMRDMTAKGRHHTAPMPAGENHARSVLTNEIVVEIRQRAERGETTRQIANALSRPFSTIHNVVTNRTWRTLR